MNDHALHFYYLRDNIASECSITKIGFNLVIANNLNLQLWTRGADNTPLLKNMFNKVTEMALSY